MQRIKYNQKRKHPKHKKFRFGRKGLMKEFGWVSNHITPTGKIDKRSSNKKVRNSKNLINGCYYRKLWGPMHWC